MKPGIIPLKDNPLVWDCAIALSLILAGAIATLSSVLLEGMLSWLITGIFCIGLILIAYGSFIEPKRLKVNTKSIHMKGLPPLTIAIIGDLHVGPYKRDAFVQRVVTEANNLKADIIVLVGDYLYDHLSDIRYLSPLKNLKAAYGVFAVRGNHDSGEYIDWSGRYYTLSDRSSDVQLLLSSFGITFLRDASASITINGAILHIAGVDGQWRHQMKLEKTFKNIPTGEPVILLSHNPDVILDPLSSRATLIASGHTHGGQIRLPLIGALPAIPDELGRKYDQGIFALQSGTTLAITHGAGESGVRARLFCIPEILALEINRHNL